MTEKVALVVPTRVTDNGARRLTTQLNRVNVKVLGKSQNLFFVPYGKTEKRKLVDIADIGEFHTNVIPVSTINRLPHESQRLATLWNWSLVNKQKRLTEGSVKTIMRKLNLEIRPSGEVFDNETRKSLGKIERDEGFEKKGNWWIYSWWDKETFPGWCGYFRKWGTKSKTYVDQARTRRLVVDQIIAEVDSSHSFAWTKKYNRSYAYAYAWAYVWVWESDWCDHWSWAKKNGSTAQVSYRKTIRP